MRSGTMDARSDASRSSLGWAAGPVSRGIAGAHEKGLIEARERSPAAVWDASWSHRGSAPARLVDPLRDGDHFATAVCIRTGPPRRGRGDRHHVAARTAIRTGRFPSRRKCSLCSRGDRSPIHGGAEPCEDEVVEQLLPARNRAAQPLLPCPARRAIRRHRPPRRDARARAARTDERVRARRGTGDLPDGGLSSFSP
jgi:hypothetical protein